MNKEQHILDTISATMADPSPLSDDAFVDTAQGLVMTTDALVEGNHFSLEYFSPQDLGWKLVAVNASDVAATGAAFKYLMVTLGIPDWVDTGFIDALYQGINQCLASIGGQLVGGDTVFSPHMMLSATAIGQMPKDHAPGRRSSARPGDVIIATGYSGLSTAGLQALIRNKPGCEAARQAHLCPKPRVSEGLFLSGRFRRYALMDTSDGLADALLKIAQASQVRLEVDPTLLMRHDDVIAYAAENDQDVLDPILYGGEDFQLVATVPTWSETLHPEFRIIGRVTEGPAQAVLTAGQGDVSRTLQWERTYNHFNQQRMAGSFG
jgi:thiamine-monophosphate kinase